MIEQRNGIKGSPSLAIVGATGLAGETAIEILKRDQGAEFGKVSFFASTAEHPPIDFRGESLPVLPVQDARFEDYSFCLFATESSVSKIYVPKALEAGSIVVDKSSLWRLDPEVPLVVPWVNSDAMDAHHKLIANPNCTTTLLVSALNVLHRAGVGLELVKVTTYQAISGAGRDALKARDEQALNPDSMKDLKPENRLFMNACPSIGEIDEDGYSEEERKIRDETRKILGLPNLLIDPRTMRVDTQVGHLLHVYVHTKTPIAVEEFTNLLKDARQIKVPDNNSERVDARFVAGKDDVWVSGVRLMPSSPALWNGGVSFLVAGDNLGPGAAVNALKIIEEIMRRQRQ